MVYGHGEATYTLGPGDSLQLDGEGVHGPQELLALPIRFLSVVAYGDAGSRRRAAFHVERPRIRARNERNPGAPPRCPHSSPQRSSPSPAATAGVVGRREDVVSQSASASGAPPVKKRDRTHYLYVAVIVAVLAGIVVGLAAPELGKALKPLGTGFVALIKMMISPVIFCTIVLGIGSIRQAAKVGKVGGLALLYFIAMSTVALVIGLLVGNILHPGQGLVISEAGRAAAEKAATGEAQTTGEFLLGIIPTTLVSPLTGESVLSTLFVALLVGFAVQSLGSSGPGRAARDQALRARGLPDPRDDHVGGPDRRVRRDRRGRRRDRLDRSGRPRPDHARLLHHLLPVRRARARLAAPRRHRPVDLQADEVPGPGVPAHRLDLLVGVGPAAPHRQARAHGRLAARRRDHRAHRLLVQPRRHRHLPDDGVAVHRRPPWAARCRWPSRSRCCCS